MLKRLLYILFLTAIATWVYGQKVVEFSKDLGRTTSLTLELDFADSIKVTRSNSANLILKATVNINDNQNNDNFELKQLGDGNLFTLKEKINDLKSLKSSQKGRNGSHFYSNCYGGINIEIFYEIQVPDVEWLKIKTISGDITVNKLELPMKLESISGFIDLSLPKESNSYVHIQTVTGEVFTNHELNKDIDECKTNPASTKLHLMLNKGTTPIELKTISSDIFLRKI